MQGRGGSSVLGILDLLTPGKMDVLTRLSQTDQELARAEQASREGVLAFRSQAESREKDPKKSKQESHHSQSKPLRPKEEKQEDEEFSPGLEVENLSYSVQGSSALAAVGIKDQKTLEKEKKVLQQKKRRLRPTEAQFALKEKENYKQKSVPRKEVIAAYEKETALARHSEEEKAPQRARILSVGVLFDKKHE